MCALVYHLAHHGEKVVHCKRSLYGCLIMVKGGLRNVDTLSFLSSTFLEETLTNLTA